MLHYWRHPVICYVAIFALAIVAALPAQLLADCCCRRAEQGTSSCCSPEATDSAACCCAAPAEATCCTATVAEEASAAPTSCCESFTSTQRCDCATCAETPAEPPVVTPRAEDAPRVDLTFLAIPAVGITAITETTPVAFSPAPDEGYLPPPVRERFCVWTI